MRTTDDARREDITSLIGLMPIEMRENATREELDKIHRCLDAVWNAGNNHSYSIWKDGCAMNGACYLSALLR